MDLSTLLAAAAAALQGLPAASDARVRELPDERTFRYYQSVGLVDRPLRHDGRIAIYGRRHLLQLVCVKLLQARGLSLAQIQRALAGAADAQLEAALADAGAVADAAVEPARPAPPAPARVAAEIAPGVLVVIDPAVVADPAALLSLLTRALPGGSR